MIFNPVIVGAIVVQSFIAKSSRIAGAITGYVITTGIMFWGLSLYSDGSQIEFFGIPLSQSAFIIACLIWYGFDTKAFITAKKVSDQSIESPQNTTPDYAHQALEDRATKAVSYEEEALLRQQQKELYQNGICPQCKETIDSKYTKCFACDYDFYENKLQE